MIIPGDDELRDARAWFSNAYEQYVQEHGRQPTHLYINHDEELASYLMWVAMDMRMEICWTNEPTKLSHVSPIS